MESIGRMIILIGIILVVVGGVLLIAGRFGLTPGKLPGDIRIAGQNFTCVFALGTSLLLSALLTIILNVVVRLLKK